MKKQQWCKEYSCWCNEVDEFTKNKYACNMECLGCDECVLIENNDLMKP